MLRIRLSITLFNKRKTCQLTENDAVYILESIRKVPDNKGYERPFVCITGYNGMAIHILEESFEDFPPGITIKQGIAYDGNNKNIIKGFRKSWGKDPDKTSFGNILNDCLADGLHIVSTVSELNDKHLIALFASSHFSSYTKTKTDYHFFRPDANGEWSHKNGHSNVTNRDFSGRIIKDVMACNRGRFNISSVYLT